MSLPEFQPSKLTTALEQAIYNAHTHRNHTPSLTILVLPDWKHTPYLAQNLHTNYVQHVATIPHKHATQHHHHPKYNIHIYLVANSKALTRLDATNIHKTLNTSLTHEYGHITQTHKIDTTRLEKTNRDCCKSYTNTPTPTQPRPNTTILQTTQHKRRWNPRDFIYTEGSQVKGTHTLGARLVNPRTNTITHIDIKSQPERHTINRAELAAIAMALKQYNIENHTSILTDNSFCINTIRNYTIDPASYNQHLHKDLLQLTNQLQKIDTTNNSKHT
jgi:ribonuclease HI